ncbi:hypothetical protein T484DRAFT_1901321, partial [Baffinella frigidus]
MPKRSHKRAVPEGGGGGGAGPSGGKKPRKSKAEGKQEGPLVKGVTDWAAFIKKVPRTIAFAGFHEVEVPEEWATKKGGVAAANCLEEVDACRLAGIVTLKFDVADPSILAALTSPINPTIEAMEKGDGVITWNTDGEPGSHDCFTVGRLLAAVNKGDLLPHPGCGSAPDTLKLLQAMNEHIVPDNSSADVPWLPMPLLRVICPHLASSLLASGDVAMEDAAGGGAGAGAKAKAGGKSGGK